MTKSPSSSQPLPAIDFTIELFCRVDDALQDEKKPALAHLYPSEVVTIGLLQALKGQGYRAFYRWLRKELGHLFPRLPEQSRLFRLLNRYRTLAERFMAEETVLGVCDTLGIELLHPRREGRCWWHFARKGKCNGRWIVGAKFFVLLNQWGQVVRWNYCPANHHDQIFHCVIEDFQEKMIVLADQGFKARATNPSNLKICQRGKWNQRMLIETAFSLFEGVLQLKKLDRRLSHTLAAHLAYAAAIYNICINWKGKVQMSLIHFAL
jgi:hypothetical protein